MYKYSQIYFLIGNSEQNGEVSERLLHFLSEPTAVPVQVPFLHFNLSDQAPVLPQTFSLYISALRQLS